MEETDAIPLIPPTHEELLRSLSVESDLEFINGLNAVGEWPSDIKADLRHFLGVMIRCKGILSKALIEHPYLLVDGPAPPSTDILYASSAAAAGILRFLLLLVQNSYNKAIFLGHELLSKLLAARSDLLADYALMLASELMEPPRFYVARDEETFHEHLSKDEQFQTRLLAVADTWHSVAHNTEGELTSRFTSATANEAPSLSFIDYANLPSSTVLPSIVQLVVDVPEHMHAADLPASVRVEHYADSTGVSCTKFTISNISDISHHTVAWMVTEDIAAILHVSSGVKYLLHCRIRRCLEALQCGSTAQRHWHLARQFIAMSAALRCKITADKWCSYFRGKGIVYGEDIFHIALAGLSESGDVWHPMTLSCSYDDNTDSSASVLSTMVGLVERRSLQGTALATIFSLACCCVVSDGEHASNVAALVPVASAICWHLGISTAVFGRVEMYANSIVAAVGSAMQAERKVWGAMTRLVSAAAAIAKDAHQAAINSRYDYAQMCLLLLSLCLPAMEAPFVTAFVDMLVEITKGDIASRAVTSLATCAVGVLSESVLMEAASARWVGAAVRKVGLGVFCSRIAAETEFHLQNCQIRLGYRDVGTEFLQDDEFSLGPSASRANDVKYALSVGFIPEWRKELLAALIDVLSDVLQPVEGVPMTEVAEISSVAASIVRSDAECMWSPSTDAIFRACEELPGDAPFVRALKQVTRFSYAFGPTLLSRMLSLCEQVVQSDPSLCVQLYDRGVTPLLLRILFERNFPCDPTLVGILPTVLSNLLLTDTVRERIGQYHEARSFSAGKTMLDPTSPIFTALPSRSPLLAALNPEMGARRRRSGSLADASQNAPPDIAAATAAPGTFEYAITRHDRSGSYFHIVDLASRVLTRVYGDVEFRAGLASLTPAKQVMVASMAALLEVVCPPLQLEGPLSVDNNDNLPSMVFAPSASQRHRLTKGKQGTFAPVFTNVDLWCGGLHTEAGVDIRGATWHDRPYFISAGRTLVSAEALSTYAKPPVAQLHRVCEPFIMADNQDARCTEVDVRFFCPYWEHDTFSLQGLRTILVDRQGCIRTGFNSSFWQDLAMRYVEVFESHPDLGIWLPEILRAVLCHMISRLLVTRSESDSLVDPARAAQSASGVKRRRENTSMSAHTQTALVAHYRVADSVSAMAIIVELLCELLKQANSDLHQKLLLCLVSTPMWKAGAWKISSDESVEYDFFAYNPGLDMLYMSELHEEAVEYLTDVVKQTSCGSVPPVLAAMTRLACWGSTLPQNFVIMYMLSNPGLDSFIEGTVAARHVLDLERNLGRCLLESEMSKVRQILQQAVFPASMPPKLSGNDWWLPHLQTGAGAMRDLQSVLSTLDVNRVCMVPGIRVLECAMHTLLNDGRGSENPAVADFSLAFGGVPDVLSCNPSLMQVHCRLSALANTPVVASGWGAYWRTHESTNRAKSVIYGLQALAIALMMLEHAMATAYSLTAVHHLISQNFDAMHRTWLSWVWASAWQGLISDFLVESTCGYSSLAHVLIDVASCVRSIQQLHAGQLPNVALSFLSDLLDGVHVASLSFLSTVACTATLIPPSAIPIPNKYDRRNGKIVKLAQLSPFAQDVVNAVADSLLCMRSSYPEESPSRLASRAPQRPPADVVSPQASVDRMISIFLQCAFCPTSSWSLGVEEFPRLLGLSAENYRSQLLLESLTKLDNGFRLNTLLLYACLKNGFLDSLFESIGSSQFSSENGAVEGTNLVSFLIEKIANSEYICSSGFTAATSRLSKRIMCAEALQRSGLEKRHVITGAIAQQDFQSSMKASLQSIVDARLEIAQFSGPALAMAVQSLALAHLSHLLVMRDRLPSILTKSLSDLVLSVHETDLQTGDQAMEILRNPQPLWDFDGRLRPQPLCFIDVDFDPLSGYGESYAPNFLPITAGFQRVFRGVDDHAQYLCATCFHVILGELDAENCRCPVCKAVGFASDNVLRKDSSVGNIPSRSPAAPRPSHASPARRQFSASSIAEITAMGFSENLAARAMRSVAAASRGLPLPEDQLVLNAVEYLLANGGFLDTDSETDDTDSEDDDSPAADQSISVTAPIRDGSPVTAIVARADDGSALPFWLRYAWKCTHATTLSRGESRNAERAAAIMQHARSGASKSMLFGLQVASNQLQDMTAQGGAPFVAATYRLLHQGLRQTGGPPAIEIILSKLVTDIGFTPLQWTSCNYEIFRMLDSDSFTSAVHALVQSRSARMMSKVLSPLVDVFRHLCSAIGALDATAPVGSNVPEPAKLVIIVRLLARLLDLFGSAQVLVAVPACKPEDVLSFDTAVNMIWALSKVMDMETMSSVFPACCTVVEKLLQLVNPISQTPAGRAALHTVFAVLVRRIDFSKLTITYSNQGRMPRVLSVQLHCVARCLQAAFWQTGSALQKRIHFRRLLKADGDDSNSWTSAKLLTILPISVVYSPALREVARSSIFEKPRIQCVGPLRTFGLQPRPFMDLIKGTVQNAMISRVQEVAALLLPPSLTTEPGIIQCKEEEHLKDGLTGEVHALLEGVCNIASTAELSYDAYENKSVAEFVQLLWDSAHPIAANGSNAAVALGPVALAFCYFAETADVEHVEQMLRLPISETPLKTLEFADNVPVMEEFQRKAGCQIVGGCSMLLLDVLIQHLLPELAGLSKLEPGLVGLPTQVTLPLLPSKASVHVSTCEQGLFSTDRTCTLSMPNPAESFQTAAQLVLRLLKAVVSRFRFSSCLFDLIASRLVYSLYLSSVLTQRLRSEEGVRLGAVVLLTMKEMLDAYTKPVLVALKSQYRRDFRKSVGAEAVASRLAIVRFLRHGARFALLDSMKQYHATNSGLHNVELYMVVLQNSFSRPDVGQAFEAASSFSRRYGMAVSIATEAARVQLTILAAVRTGRVPPLADAEEAASHAGIVARLNSLVSTSLKSAHKLLSRLQSMIEIGRCFADDVIHILSQGDIVRISHAEVEKLQEDAMKTGLFDESVFELFISSNKIIADKMRGALTAMRAPSSDDEHSERGPSGDADISGIVDHVMHQLSNAHAPSRTSTEDSDDSDGTSSRDTGDSDLNDLSMSDGSFPGDESDDGSLLEMDGDTDNDHDETGSVRELTDALMHENMGVAFSVGSTDESQLTDNEEFGHSRDRMPFMSVSEADDHMPGGASPDDDDSGGSHLHFADIVEDSSGSEVDEPDLLDLLGSHGNRELDGEHVGFDTHMSASGFRISRVELVGDARLRSVDELISMLHGRRRNAGPRLGGRSRRLRDNDATDAEDLHEIQVSLSLPASRGFKMVRQDTSQRSSWDTHAATQSWMPTTVLQLVLDIAEAVSRRAVQHKPSCPNSLKSASNRIVDELCRQLQAPVDLRLGRPLQNLADALDTHGLTNASVMQYIQVIVDELQSHSLDVAGQCQDLTLLTHFALLDHVPCLHLLLTKLHPSGFGPLPFHSFGVLGMDSSGYIPPTFDQDARELGLLISTALRDMIRQPASPEVKAVEEDHSQQMDIFSDTASNDAELSGLLLSLRNRLKDDIVFSTSWRVRLSEIVSRRDMAYTDATKHAEIAFRAVAAEFGQDLNGDDALMPSSTHLSRVIMTPITVLANQLRQQVGDEKAQELMSELLKTGTKFGTVIPAKYNHLVLSDVDAECPHPAPQGASLPSLRDSWGQLVMDPSDPPLATSAVEDMSSTLESVFTARKSADSDILATLQPLRQSVYQTVAELRKGILGATSEVAVDEDLSITDLVLGGETETVLDSVIAISATATLLKKCQALFSDHFMNACKDCDVVCKSAVRQDGIFKNLLSGSVFGRENLADHAGHCQKCDSAYLLINAEACIQSPLPLQFTSKGSLNTLINIDLAPLQGLLTQHDNAGKLELTEIISLCEQTSALVLGWHLKRTIAFCHAASTLLAETAPAAPAVSDAESAPVTIDAQRGAAESTEAVDFSTIRFDFPVMSPPTQPVLPSFVPEGIDPDVFQELPDELKMELLSGAPQAVSIAEDSKVGDSVPQVDAEGKIVLSPKSAAAEAGPRYLPNEVAHDKIGVVETRRLEDILASAERVGISIVQSSLLEADLPSICPLIRGTVASALTTTAFVPVRRRGAFVQPQRDSAALTSDGNSIGLRIRALDDSFVTKNKDVFQTQQGATEHQGWLIQLFSKSPTYDILAAQTLRRIAMAGLARTAEALARWSNSAILPSASASHAIVVPDFVVAENMGNTKRNALLHIMDVPVMPMIADKAVLKNAGAGIYQLRKSKNSNVAIRDAVDIFCRAVVNGIPEDILLALILNVAPSEEVFHALLDWMVSVCDGTIDVAQLSKTKIHVEASGNVTMLSPVYGSTSDKHLNYNSTQAIIQLIQNTLKLLISRLPQVVVRAFTADCGYDASSTVHARATPGQKRKREQADSTPTATPKMLRGPDGKRVPSKPALKPSFLSRWVEASHLPTVNSDPHILKAHLEILAKLLEPLEAMERAWREAFTTARRLQLSEALITLVDVDTEGALDLVQNVLLDAACKGVVFTPSTVDHLKRMQPLEFRMATWPDRFRSVIETCSNPSADRVSSCGRFNLRSDDTSASIHTVDGGSNKEWTIEDFKEQLCACALLLVSKADSCSVLQTWHALTATLYIAASCWKGHHLARLTGILHSFEVSHRDHLSCCGPSDAVCFFRPTAQNIVVEPADEALSYVFEVLTMDAMDLPLTPLTRRIPGIAAAAGSRELRECIVTDTGETLFWWEPFEGYLCPVCPVGDNGSDVHRYSRGELVRHCVRFHENDSGMYACPICEAAAGSAHRRTRNLTGHIILRHAWCIDHHGINTGVPPSPEVDAVKLSVSESDYLEEELLAPGEMFLKPVMQKTAFFRNENISRAVRRLQTSHSTPAKVAVWSVRSVPTLTAEALKALTELLISSTASEIIQQIGTIFRVVAIDPGMRRQLVASLFEAMASRSRDSYRNLLVLHTAIRGDAGGSRSTTSYDVQVVDEQLLVAQSALLNLFGDSELLVVRGDHHRQLTVGGVQSCGVRGSCAVFETAFDVLQDLDRTPAAHRRSHSVGSSDSSSFVSIDELFQLDELWRCLHATIYEAAVAEGIEEDHHKGSELAGVSHAAAGASKRISSLQDPVHPPDTNVLKSLCKRFLALILAFFQAHPVAIDADVAGTVADPLLAGVGPEAQPLLLAEPARKVGIPPVVRTSTRHDSACQPTSEANEKETQPRPTAHAVHRRLSHFTEQHREILNEAVRQDSNLLMGPLYSLVGIKECRIFLDFGNKTTYFRQQLKRLHKQGDHHPIQLQLRRKKVFLDSFVQFQNLTGEELRGKLDIRFKGEEGVDAGGLSREWYEILAREMFNPDYALFKLSEDGTTFQPNPMSGVHDDHLSYFRFVGRVLGKAVADGQMLDAHFTRSFYKHMLGVPITYHDIEAIDPQFYKSLNDILNMEIDDLGLELYFVAEQEFGGKTTEIELIPGGKAVAVTDENKLDYVQLVTSHKMTSSIMHQTNALLAGFHELIPPSLISLFTESELELLIAGLPTIDIADLKANTDYIGYRSEDDIIQWFWEVLESFDQQDRARFLMFVTGTSKVPPGGFKALRGQRGPQKFTVEKSYGNEESLPQSHTCFNTINIPFSYSSPGILREKLLIAIREGGEGFGLV